MEEKVQTSLSLQACTILALRELKRLEERPELAESPSLRMRIRDLQFELRRLAKSSGVFEVIPDDAG